MVNYYNLENVEHYGNNWVNNLKINNVRFFFSFFLNNIIGLLTPNFWWENQKRFKEKFGKKHTFNIFVNFFI